MSPQINPRELQAAIAAEQRKTTELRALERQVRSREHMISGGLGSGPVSPGGTALVSELQKLIPPKFLPGNLGKLADLQWPNFIPVPRFNLGQNPLVTPGVEITQGVEIGQEASFVVMAIARFSWEEVGSAGEKAPLSITIRSRQSSRQFNDNPIPIQMIGDLSHPFVLPVPLPVQAQNFIDITLKTWVTGAPVQLAGDGRHDFILFGQRMKEGQEFTFLKNYLKNL